MPVASLGLVLVSIGAQIRATLMVFMLVELSEMAGLSISASMKVT